MKLFWYDLVDLVGSKATRMIGKKKMVW